MDQFTWLVIGICLLAFTFGLLLWLIHRNEEVIEDMDYDDQSKGITDDDVNVITTGFWGKWKPQNEQFPQDNHGDVVHYGDGTL